MGEAFKKAISREAHAYQGVVYRSLGKKAPKL